MKKLQLKYLYRYICTVLIITIATAMFTWVWVKFVSIHNQTGHLTGPGNIGMAVLIYIFLFGIIGHWLHAFKIGVDRKSAVIASLALTVGTVDFIELFLSLAITGEFFFNEFFCEYLFLCIVQGVVICSLAIPMINI